MTLYYAQKDCWISGLFNGIGQQLNLSEAQAQSYLLEGLIAATPPADPAAPVAVVDVSDRRKAARTD